MVRTTRLGGLALSLFWLTGAGRAAETDGPNTPCRGCERVSLKAAREALGPAVELPLAVRHERAGGGAIEKRRITFRRLPVFNLGMNVEVGKDGSSQMLGRIELDPAAQAAADIPLLSEKEVAARIARLPGHPPLTGAGTLGYLASVEKSGGARGLRTVRALRLVWRIGLFARAGELELPPLEIATIDSDTGELLGIQSNAVYATAPGQGFHNGAVDVETSPGLNPGELCLTDQTRGITFPAVSGCGATDQGISVWSSVDSSDNLMRVTDSDGLFGNGGFSSTASSLVRSGVLTDAAQTTAVDTLYSVETAYDFFRALFGRTWLGGTGILPVRVNTTRFPGNAAAVASDNTLWVGLPGDPRLRKPLSDLKSILHEYGHLTLAHETTFPTSAGSEFAAIHEGFGDIVGVIGHAWATNEPSRFDPLIPKNWVWGDLAFPDNPAEWRYLDQPNLDLKSVNAYGESDSSGLSFVALDPHKKSGPMRRWFYFLAQGVERLNPFFPGPTWQRRGSLYLPGGLQGIGIGRALHVLNKTITEMLLPGEEPTYGDLRDAMDLTVMLESFEATGDVCPPERMAVRDAWAAVNVGRPADRVAPRLALEAHQFGQTVIVRATVDESDDGLDSSSVDLRINGIRRPFALSEASRTDTTSVWTGADSILITDPAVTPNGFQTVTLALTDSCHNRASASATVFVDSTPPLLASVTDVTTERRALRRFRVRASDASKVRSIRLAVAGRTTGEILIDPPAVDLDRIVDFDLTEAVHGLASIEATAEDIFGNRSQLVIPGYFVDRRPPQLCEISKCTQVVAGTKLAYCELHAWDDARDTSDAASKQGVQMLEVWIDSEAFWADRSSPSPHKAHFDVSSAAPPGYWVHYPRSSADLAGPGDHTGRGACTDGWGNSALAPQYPFRVSDLPNLLPTPTVGGGTYRLRIDGSDGPDGGDNDSIRQAYARCGSATSSINCPAGGPPCLTLSAQVTGPLAAGQSIECHGSVTDVYGASRVWDQTLTAPSAPPPPPPPTPGTGDLSFRLTWHGTADLDLHVRQPNGEEIWFGHTISQAGGRLDVDANAGCTGSPTPIENVFWPVGQGPHGTYEFWVHYFSRCNDSTSQSYHIDILRGNTVVGGQGGWVDVPLDSNHYTYTFP